jgi:hypothetical protein
MESLGTEARSVRAATAQCTVRFRPEEVDVSRGELLIKYDDGDVVSAELAGLAVEAEVGLNVDFVQCQPTFITCTNQKSFKVVNHSSEVITFAFKQHQYAEEESAAQVRLPVATQALSPCWLYCGWFAVLRIAQCV